MTSIKEFEIIHYPRLGNYLVKDKQEHKYLQLNELTGGVVKVNNLKDATVLNNRGRCIDLINWYNEKTPKEVETLNLALENS